MKRILGIFLGLFLFTTLLQAEGFVKKGKAGSINVEIVSDKPLAAGDNYFTITLKQGGKPLNDATVRCKAYMPEMAGMPYMETTNKALFKGEGAYTTDLALSMHGTWQLRIYIDTKEGKKYQYKGSLIF